MLFAAAFAVSTGTLVAISLLLFQLAAEHRVTMVQDVEIHAVDIRQGAIGEVLAASVSDLLFISELNEIGAFLAAPTSDTRAALARELVAFARGHRAHNRITILSPSGDEILRVDQAEGSPVLAPEEELGAQRSADDALALSSTPSGAIHVAAPHVARNATQADREITFALALTEEGGTIAGYVLVGLELSAVTDAFAHAHPDEGVAELLVDGRGGWVFAPPQEPESAEPAAPQDVGDFPNRFPAAWKLIAAAQDGQFETAEGLFTFDTLALSSEVDRVRTELSGPSPASVPEDADILSWKNVSWVPPATMAATRRAGLGHLTAGDAVGVLLLGTGTWFFTRWAKRRSDLQRKTTHEKDLLQSTLGKYMPSQIRDRLLGDPARHARLGGEAQDVAVLFADIRGFTSFAERRSPEETVAVLNRTMAELSAPLRVYGGILDKYVGDGLLAFFEPSPDLPSAARRAVEAARVMQRAFRGLWSNSSNEELRALGLGVGVSAGRVVVGNIGSEESMDYTVVGDPVNVASRLQDLAAPGEILISQTTYDLLQDETKTEILPQTRLRGRQQPVDVHRLRPAE